jgi:hypothetical protein
VNWYLKDGGNVQASIQGKAYFNPLPSSMRAVEAPLPVSNTSVESVLTTVASTELVPQEGEDVGSVELGKKNLFE